MSFFELDDVFGYQDANEIKKLWASDTAPSDPGDGEVWLDTSVTPNRLKRYTGSGWETVGDMTAGELLTLLKTVDGTGSGLDADKLDGQEGSYYQNASNLDSGTIPSDRLSANDLLTKIETVDGSGSGLDADKVDGLEASAFVRNDANTDVNAHTEWQDTYQARFGNSADLRIQHNGSVSYIDNHNGDMYIRQLSHGNNINVQAENDSGTMQTLLTLDPDTPKAAFGGAMTSVITESYSLAQSAIFSTGIGADSHGILIVVNETDKVSAAFYIFSTPATELAGNGEIKYLARDSAYFLPNWSTDHVSMQVYWSSSNSQIQIRNNLGAAKNVSYTFMGLRFDV